MLAKARKSTEEALEQLDAWTEGKQWQAARDVISDAERKTAPLFSVLRAGIAFWEELVEVGETRLDVMEAMVGGAVNRELKLVRAMLRANLSILANISSVAPFIGLFGTVVGIILTFDAISRSGNMGQNLVASGIADALIATAMGLFAAIPAVLAYNYFVERVSGQLLEMEEIALLSASTSSYSANKSHCPSEREDNMQCPGPSDEEDGPIAAIYVIPLVERAGRRRRRSSSWSPPCSPATRR